MDEDNASRMAAFISGKYDIGWENPGTINRTDWVQLKDVMKQKRPRLQTMEYAANQMSHIYMRADKPPFSDVRVRRAISMALDRQGMIDATYEGVGTLNPAVPPGLKEWALPIDQLGEGAQYYKFDPARAKRLLAEAGFPNGFPATISYATYGSTIAGGPAAAHPEIPQGRGHRRQAEPAGVRRLHLHHVLRQVRVDGLRPPDPFLDPDNFLYGPTWPTSSRTRATSRTRW